MTDHDDGRTGVSRTNDHSDDSTGYRQPLGMSRRQFVKTGAALGAGGLALGGANSASAAKVEEVCEGQDDYEEIQVSDSMAIIDNQWGMSDVHQCIWLNDDDSYGWDVDASNQGPDAGINYPQAYVGDRPWGKSTGVSDFPARRGDIDELIMEVDVDINLTGPEWNLAEEWWLMNGQPDPSASPQYEIMLVLDANSGHRDAWTPFRQQNIATDQFDNTIDFWAINDGGTNAPQWIFGVQGGMRSGKVDLMEILDFVTQQEGSQLDDMTFTGVELGTEYRGGTSGDVTFNEFDVTVNGTTYTSGSGGGSSTPTDTPTDTPEDDGPPAVGGGNRPTDPDGDGLYEDVNGNGNGDLADAVDLYQNRNSGAVQNNVDAYDFSGNDSIDLADVVELYQENTS